MNWEKRENVLVKEFEFNDFKESVSFVNQIVPFAEKADHHPDILIHSYKKVRIELTTHSEGRITEKDYALAKDIDWLHISWQQKSPPDQEELW